MEKQNKFLFSKFCIVALIILLGCSKSEIGPSGLISLVKVTQEEAGANCTSGGLKIETGIDKNKNSVLDTDEIQNTAYVCNGATGISGTTGQAGVDGLTSLIKVTDEAAEVNCAAGGYRIDTGIDDNANGMLDTNEIDNTIYVCNGSDGSLVNYGKQAIVLIGDVTDEEAAQIIANDLGPATQEVMIFGCTNLTTVDLSKMESAVSIEVYNNSSLKTLNLSGLKSIVGQLRIESSPIEKLYFDALENLVLKTSTNNGTGGSINSTKLTQLSFPSLVSIGFMEDGYNDNFEIIENDQLQSISFPELTEVIGVLTSNPDYPIWTIYIESKNLSMLSIPKLAKFTNTNFDLSGKLSSADVNSILANFVQISPAITNTKITLQMNPAAPPTDQGITDKATLVANGNNVATD